MPLAERHMTVPSHVQTLGARKGMYGKRVKFT